MFARAYPWTRWAWPALLASPLSCFDPPERPVQFRCEPMGADVCPSGYRCEADGCCHRAGTDLEVTWNACYVADPDDSGTGTGTGTGTTASSSTSGQGTTQDTMLESTGAAPEQGSGTAEQDSDRDAAESSSGSTGP